MYDFILLAVFMHGTCIIYRTHTLTHAHTHAHALVQITIYFSALEYVVIVMTSVGFGDIVPITNIERLFTVLLTSTSVVFLAYLIGNMTSILSSLDSTDVVYKQRMRAINSFMKYKNIPMGLQKRIYDFYDYCFEHAQMFPFTEETVLGDLSFSLRRELAMAMHGDVLDKVCLSLCVCVCLYVCMSICVYDCMIECLCVCMHPRL